EADRQQLRGRERPRGPPDPPATPDPPDPDPRGAAGPDDPRPVAADDELRLRTRDAHAGVAGDDRARAGRAERRPGTERAARAARDSDQACALADPLQELHRQPRLADAVVQHAPGTAPADVRADLGARELLRAAYVGDARRARLRYERPAAGGRLRDLD